MNRPKRGKDNCPICNVTFTKGHAHRVSKDHILPKAYGYGGAPWGVNNIKYLCSQCNTLRGDLGHCVAMVSCVLDVAQQLNANPYKIRKDWIKDNPYVLDELNNTIRQYKKIREGP